MEKMMDAQTLTAWLLLMFPLVYSPGPANTLYASNGALFGFRRSLHFMAGVNISFFLQSLLVGFGLNGVLHSVPQALLGLKIAGIAYILWLAYGFLRNAKQGHLRDVECLTLQDGLLLTFCNPKAWVMQAMMFSQFLSPEHGPERVFMLSGLLAVLNLSGHCTWVMFGDLALGRAAHGLSARNQNLLFGLMLLGSVWFMV